MKPATISKIIGYAGLLAGALLLLHYAYNFAAGRPTSFLDLALAPGGIVAGLRVLRRATTNAKP